MATAFMGYVLPFGQMSFWGATVITNLLSEEDKDMIVNEISLVIQNIKIEFQLYDSDFISFTALMLTACLFFFLVPGG